MYTTGREIRPNKAPIYNFGVLLVPCLLVFIALGCGNRDAMDADGVHPVLLSYTETPEPGVMRPLPHAVYDPSFARIGSENLLYNPSFDNGLVSWTLHGPGRARYDIIDEFRTDGEAGLQLIPSARGEATVVQTVDVKPQTFYAFSAFIFLPGESEAVLEARDEERDAVVASESLRGPRSEWSQIGMAFVTGAQTTHISVGIRGIDHADNAPILIDQCALNELPPRSFLRENTMRNESDEERMAEWYTGGASATPVSDAFRGEHAFELPLRLGRPATLFALIPSRAELEGRDVWVSAVIRSESYGGRPGPNVTMKLQLTNADGDQTEVSETVPATGDWVEAALHATIPEQIVQDEAGGLPFQVLRFERPSGIEGRVLIDEVKVLEIPNLPFSGGLVPNVTAE